MEKAEEEEGGWVVELSKICEWYKGDMSKEGNEEGLFRQVEGWVGEETRRRLIEAREKGERLRVVYAPYDWKVNAKE